MVLQRDIFLKMFCLFRQSFAALFKVFDFSAQQRLNLIGVVRAAEATAVLGWAAAAAVAPTVRVVEPRPLVDRTAAIVAPESATTAANQWQRGAIWAEMALEFEALGAAHTSRDAPKKSSHRPVGRWKGGRPPPTQRRSSGLLPPYGSSP